MKIKRGVRKSHVGLSGIVMVVLLLGLQSASVRGDEYIWDGVYTINPSNHQILIENLPFREHWFHELSFQVVSPHECHANITIIDSGGFHFELFSGSLGQSEIILKYGAVMDGFHDIAICIDTQATLNLRIKVRQTEQILDGLGFLELPLAYQVFRFSASEPYRALSFPFTENETLEFYMFQVTPLKDEVLPKINVSLEDPGDNQFIIYQDKNLLDGPLEFEFQTTNLGIHELKMYILTKNNSLNLAVMIFPETSDAPPSVDNPSLVTYWIPLESQLLSFGLLLFLLLLPYMLIKKKARIMDT